MQAGRDALAVALSLFAAANAAAIESLGTKRFVDRPSGALALDAVPVTATPRNRACTLYVENRAGVVGAGLWVLRRFRAGSARSRR